MFLLIRYYLDTNTFHYFRLIICSNAFKYVFIVFVHMLLLNGLQPVLVLLLRYLMLVYHSFAHLLPSRSAGAGIASMGKFEQRGGMIPTTVIVMALGLLLAAQHGFAAGLQPNPNPNPNLRLQPAPPKPSAGQLDLIQRGYGRNTTTTAAAASPLPPSMGARLLPGLTMFMHFGPCTPTNLYKNRYIF